MSYTPTTWENRLVEKPKTFQLQQNVDGTVTLIPQEGEIFAEGTPVNAGNMNNIEAGIEAVTNEVIAHKADNAKQIPHLGTTTNVSNAYSVTTTETILANQKFTVKINAVSTGAATLNISSIGSGKAIKKAGGADATLKIGVYTLFYDGTNFQLLGEGGEYGTAGAAQVLPGYTIGTDSGLVTGTYSNIKSQTSGQTTWTDSNTTKDITISPVDITKTIVRVSNTLSSNPSQSLIAIVLIDTTTIRLYRESGASLGTIPINYEVIEYNNVKTLQSGNITVSPDDTEVTQSITSVNTAKSQIFISTTQSNGVENDGIICGYRFVSSTSIGFRKRTGTLKVYWQTIEFN